MRWAKYLVLGVFVWGIVIGLYGISFSQETVSVTHWTFEETGYAEFWDIVDRDFEKEYPTIKVKRHDIPAGRYWDQILVLVSAGPAPDVMGIVSTNINQFTAMEAIEPLEKWMDLTEIKRTFSEQQRTLGMEKGKTYAVIQGGRPLVLIYNKKLFEEAGIKNPPSFPPELVAATMKLTKPEKGQYGIILKVDEVRYEDTYDCLLQFPAGYGANFAENGVAAATDPNTILGVRLYKLLCDLKVTPMGIDEKVTREMFFKGKMAMTMDGPWVLTQCEVKNPETYAHVNAAMTPFANKAAIGGAHHFLIIPTLAKNKSAGGKYIQFCMREKYQRLYSDKSGTIPGNPDNASERLIRETRWFKAFQEGMKYAVTPIPPGFALDASEFMHIVVKHVVGHIVLKNEPIEETMEKCQRELMKLKEKR